MKRAAAAACVLLAACASTKVDITGPGAGQPVCTPRTSTLVLWSTQWRPDQKDAPAREAAAWRGIQRFFVRSECRIEIRNAGALPADAKAFDRVVLLTVRELGPVIRIGSPSVLEGGTEVVLETKIIDARGGKTLADLRTHWQHGGPFVIKGVASLEDDMVDALHKTLAQ